VRSEHAKELGELKEGSKKEIDAMKKLIGQDQLKNEEVNKYDLQGLSLTDAVRKLIKHVDQSKSQNSD
jgi:ribosomal protein S16